MNNPVESKLRMIRDYIEQADKQLDAGKVFDLTPIVEILQQVQTEAVTSDLHQRDYIAQNLNDFGISFIALEDKINRNNAELTNRINSLDSGDNS